jgi:uncharacterized coiled-coil protein SlyX
MKKYQILKNITLSSLTILALSSNVFANEENVDQTSQQNKQIEKLQKQINLLTKKNKELESSVSNMIPRDARAGECYSKVEVPAQYDNRIESRLIEEEKTEINIIPATYTIENRKVSLRASSTKLEIIPATYKTVEEQILVTPEKVKYIYHPAIYKTVEEQILISESYTMWKRGKGEIEKTDNATGELLCLVEVPEQYKTVTKKVIDQNAYNEKIIVPAVYKTIKTSVINTAARVKEIKIPGICKIIKVKVLKTPARENKVIIPAKYEEYQTKRKVSDSYIRWQSVLCKTNTNPNLISDLQTTLQNKGYEIDIIDGQYNTQTKKAVNQYQIDNGLSKGALTLKTLESLNLN